MVYTRIQAELKRTVTLLLNEVLKMEAKQGYAGAIDISSSTGCKFCFAWFCLFVCLLVCLFVCLFCVFIIGMARQSVCDNVAYLRQLSYRNTPL